MNLLFDPTKATNYNRTREELELFIIFCVCVQGKPALRTASSLERFLSYGKGNTPFEIIKDIIHTSNLEKALKESSLGQYKKLTYLFTTIVNSGINLKTCSIKELEKLKWISAKTSRFFILHSRPNQNLICPDTHIKKRLKKMGYKIPTSFTRKNTPYWDSIFTKLCSEIGKNNADVDLQWWTEDMSKTAL